MYVGRNCVASLAKEDYPKMAKCSPYHTITEEKPERRDVYHNDDACPDGRRIEPQNWRAPVPMRDHSAIGARFIRNTTLERLSPNGPVGRFGRARTTRGANSSASSRRRGTPPPTPSNRRPNRRKAERQAPDANALGRLRTTRCFNRRIE